MPGTPASVADEREQLLLFVGQQRDALRIAAHGLTDEQARVPSTRSDLTVGGLIKHAAFTERGWAARMAPEPAAEPAGDHDYAAYADSHVLRPDETLAEAVAALDAVAAETESVVRSIEDLARDIELPNQPWFTQRSVTVRWVLLHLIEEHARHAGHADIV